MAEEVGALGLPQPCYHGGVGAGLLCASGILPVMQRLQHAVCPLHLTPCCPASLVSAAMCKVLYIPDSELFNF